MEGTKTQNNAVRRDSGANLSQFKVFVQTHQLFPHNFECQINKVKLDLDENGEVNEEITEKSRYSGRISGIFSTENFEKQFSFNIPFSIKYKTCIALNFTTNDFSNEKLSLLNKFVFGEQKIQPLIISSDAAFHIVMNLLYISRGFQKIFEKAMDWIQQSFHQNNISCSILIDYSQKKYHVGFFWQQFHIEGMPQQISIKDILFGYSLNFDYANSQNQYSLKIGGIGSFNFNGESHTDIYIEYSLDNKKQKLQIGGTLDLWPLILQKLHIRIPVQIYKFTQKSHIMISWVADVGKKITDQIKISSK